MVHFSATLPPSFLVSCDPSLLDLHEIHRFLSGEAYWCRGIPCEIVERSVEYSLNFGLYDTAEARGMDGSPGGSRHRDQPRLVGFARIISDRATFAYLCDVFVVTPYRGRGLSKFLMRTLLAHPELQGLRRFCLMTRDAHALYEQFGFAPLDDPRRFMQRVIPDAYAGRPARE